jgi:hypothetical protein
MQIATGTINFPQTTNSGPQTASATVNMGANVTKATAILTGFRVEYSNGNDHHLGLLDVEVAIPPGGISGSNVNVNLTYGLRDWSGNWDDTYDGTLFFTVVGE